LLYPTSFYLPKALQRADEREVLKAAEVLSGAELPVIIAGNGVRLSGAYGALQELAEMLAAPVATTAAGKGVFPENHDLALGVFGTFGTPVANKLIGDADAIVFVGTKISPTDTAKESALVGPTSAEDGAGRY
jgi:acetolactate synthase-1/2/3 large subunit